MTVETDDTVERDVVAGVGPYPFSFRVFAATDLAVTVCSVATPPVPTLLTYLTHYTVSDVNDPDGGTVTLTADTASTYAGYTLDIRSNTQMRQATSLRNVARFLPETHEDALDNLQRQIQDLSRRVDSALRFPDNTLTDGTLTPISSYASKYLIITASGEIGAAFLTETGAVTAATITTLLGSSAPEQAALAALLVGDIQPLSQTTALLSSLTRSPEEIAASVTPSNYAYRRGDVRRYGADPTGVANCNAAFTAAFATGHRVFGGGTECSYRVTATPIDLRDYTQFDGEGCVILIDANVNAVTNTLGASVLFPEIRNVIFRACQNVTASCMGLVDVSHGTFENIVIDRDASGDGFAYGIRLSGGVSACYWNRFSAIEVTAVKSGFIRIDGGSNSNMFFNCVLVNHIAAYELPVGLYITNGSDNVFFGLTLEAVFKNGVSPAYAVQLDTNAVATAIYKLRVEMHTGSALGTIFNWNGGHENWIYDVYALGFVGVETGTRGSNGWSNLSTISGAATSYLPGSQVVLPTSAGDPLVDNGALKYDSTATLIKAFIAGSARAVVTSRHGKAKVEAGTATFAAATTVAVSFSAAEPNTSYQIILGPGANKTFWWSAKTVNGFTLNASSSSSDTVDWMTIR